MQMYRLPCSDSKESACNVGDLGSILGLGSFTPSLTYIYIYIYIYIHTHTHTYIHTHLHTDMILWSKVKLNSTETTKIANLCLLLF